MSDENFGRPPQRPAQPSDASGGAEPTGDLSGAWDANTQGRTGAEHTQPIPTYSARPAPTPGSAAQSGGGMGGGPTGPADAMGPQGPGMPPPSGPPMQFSGSGDQPPPRKNKSPWLVAGVAALLAAALASGGTYAAFKANDSDIGSTGNTTVVNGDPADFADAGTVNWSATAAKVTPSVVSITVRGDQNTGDQGSGVVLDKDGNIVTNNHVVSAAGKNGKVQVAFNNNQIYPAKVVGTDPSTDLAVIRVENVPDLKPVELADDTKLVVGQSTMAVGNPLGLAGTVTTGIVSALNRPVSTSGDSGDSGDSSSNDRVVTNAIQTSAAINPGNSGGALVNGSGKLIGINSSIASLSRGGGGSQSGNIGIGFAIPTSVVKIITSQLIKHGKASHALLGVSIQDAQVTNGKATLPAARVAEVSRGGPAEKAGIKKDDAIIALNGNPVTSAESLTGQVRARMFGSKATVTIVRDNHEKKVEVTLGKSS